MASSVPFVFERECEKSVADQIAGIHKVNDLDLIAQLLGMIYSEYLKIF